MSSSVELRAVSVSVQSSQRGAGAPAGATKNAAGEDAGAPLRILHNVSLRIEPGESVALIGRSGAGKTTMLRLMNGIVTPTGGSVLVDDVALASTDLIALRRRTGMIIQGSGLFPHRTVYENIATVPRLLGWPDARIREAARTLMAKMAMSFDAFKDRMPRSLSGGEQQRVGIARAMIANPPLMLCDEPFAALDPIVRRELQDAFVALRSDATIVFVTHDLAEALRVAQRIVLVDAGEIAVDCAARDFLASDHRLARQFVESAMVAA
jgi:osmoprotectant transport system ATP-binding protein